MLHMPRFIERINGELMHFFCGKKGVNSEQANWSDSKTFEKSLKLQTAKEILAETFGIPTREVEEMIQVRSCDEGGPGGHTIEA